MIAWIWARTVTCPNPACGATMPLVRSFWLGKKKGKEAWVNPIVDGKAVRFEIGTGRRGSAHRGDGQPARARCAWSASRRCRLDHVPVGGAGGPHGCPAHGGRRRRRSPADLPAADRGARGRSRDRPTRRRARRRASSTTARDFKSPSYGMTHLRRPVHRSAVDGAVHVQRPGGRGPGPHRGRCPHRRPRPGPGHPVRLRHRHLPRLRCQSGRLIMDPAVLRGWTAPKMEVLRSTFARQAIPMVWDFAEVQSVRRLGGRLLGHRWMLSRSARRST